MWLMIILTCAIGLEPLCCPPDKEPLPEPPGPALPRPEVDANDTANPDQNVCIIPGAFDGIA